VCDCYDNEPLCRCHICEGVEGEGIPQLSEKERERINVAVSKTYPRVGNLKFRPVKHHEHTTRITDDGDEALTFGMLPDELRSRIGDCSNDTPVRIECQHYAARGEIFDVCRMKKGKPARNWNAVPRFDSLNVQIAELNDERTGYVCLVEGVGYPLLKPQAAKRTTRRRRTTRTNGTASGVSTANPDSKARRFDLGRWDALGAGRFRHEDGHEIAKRDHASMPWINYKPPVTVHPSMMDAMLKERGETLEYHEATERAAETASKQEPTPDPRVFPPTPVWEHITDERYKNIENGALVYRVETEITGARPLGGFVWLNTDTPDVYYKNVLDATAYVKGYAKSGNGFRVKGESFEDGLRKVLDVEKSSGNSTPAIDAALSHAIDEFAPSAVNGNGHAAPRHAEPDAVHPLSGQTCGCVYAAFGCGCVDAAHCATNCDCERCCLVGVDDEPKSTESTRNDTISGESAEKPASSVHVESVQEVEMTCNTNGDVRGRVSSSADGKDGENVVIVCGGRTFSDFYQLQSELNARRASIGKLVTGGGRGADSLAIEWAKQNGIPVEVYEPDWERHGRGAGPRRNKRMVEESGATRLIAFEGGKGTYSISELGVRHGLEVERIPARTRDAATASSVTTAKPEARVPKPRGIESGNSMATIVRAEERARTSGDSIGRALADSVLAEIEAAKAASR